MRRLLACSLVVASLIPGRAAAAPPPAPSEDEALLRELADASSVPTRAAQRLPSGDRMVRAGMGLTVFGAITTAGGSALLAHLSWGYFEGIGIMGIAPLVVGGGITTAGALLLHFGQQRRWDRADAYAGRPPVDRRSAPRPGASLLIMGPLTLAGGATIFTWGLAELSVLNNDCQPQPFEDPWDECVEGDPETAALLLSTAGAGMLLGTTLIILGARQRTRYIDWRLAHKREIKLRPSTWVSARTVGLSLGGQF